MSKPIEDPPSLVDVLAREHCARAARLDAEALASRSESARTDGRPLRRTGNVLIADGSNVVAVGDPAATTDAGAVDAHDETDVREAATVERASNPRILVEELTRECAKRRAALDDEARRG